MLGRAMFYPSLVYNIFMAKCTSRNWYDRLDNTIIVGALPLKSVTRKLIEEENIKAMVSVTEDYELRHFTYSKEELACLGVEQIQLSTIDLTATPTPENIERAINFLLRHRQSGNSVYIHCKAGRTRSITVAACYLIQVNAWNPSQTMDFIKSKRAHVWLRKKQLDSVQNYYDSHIRS